MYGPLSDTRAEIYGLFRLLSYEAFVSSGFSIGPMVPDAFLRGRFDSFRRRGDARETVSLPAPPEELRFEMRVGSNGRSGRKEGTTSFRRGDGLVTGLRRLAGDIGSQKTRSGTAERTLKGSNGGFGLGGGLGVVALSGCCRECRTVSMRIVGRG